jgi:hypothetical protein
MVVFRGAAVGDGDQTRPVCERAPTGSVHSVWATVRRALTATSHSEVLYRNQHGKQHCNCAKQQGTALLFLLGPCVTAGASGAGPAGSEDYSFPARLGAAPLAEQPNAQVHRHLLCWYRRKPAILEFLHVIFGKSHLRLRCSAAVAPLKPSIQGRGMWPMATTTKYGCINTPFI